MTLKIALLGAGGIGFRHFQSLLEMELPTEVYVVDVSDDALTRARDEADSKPSDGVKVKYGRDVGILPNEVDVAIISTSSLVRKQLFDQLLGRAEVRFVIFEKFLFPREAEYVAVLESLRNRGIQGYVNCPGRLYKGYVELKKRIDATQGLHVFVHGSNWGLACNVIHLIDEMGFLLGSYDELACDSTALDDKLQVSKRSGYVEFTGDLLCWLGDKATLFVNSSASENVPCEYVIYNGNNVYIVSEENQTIKYVEDGGLAQKPFPILYQSRLTASVVTELVATGQCGLTRYEDTMQWHLALLRAFKQKYDKIRGCGSDTCPIT